MRQAEPQAGDVAKQLNAQMQGEIVTPNGSIAGSRKLDVGCSSGMVRKKDFLVFVQVDAETFGHAVEGSTVDAEDLSGLATMMLGDVENVKKVAAF